MATPHAVRSRSQWSGWMSSAPHAPDAGAFGPPAATLDDASRADEHADAEAREGRTLTGGTADMATQPAMHPEATLVGGQVPAHEPGAYPSLSCCGGPIELVPAGGKLESHGYTLDGKVIAYDDNGAMILLPPKPETRPTHSGATAVTRRRAGGGAGPRAGGGPVTPSR